jgi:hypothetical protein
MTFCTNCGSSLEQSRFCTQCGQPVIIPTSAVESRPTSDDAASSRPLPDDDTLSSTIPPPLYQASSPAPTPRAAGSRRMILVVTVLLVVAVAVGAATWWFTHASAAGISAVAPSVVTTTLVPTRSSPPSTAASAPASTSPPTRARQSHRPKPAPLTPMSALRLTSAEATFRLGSAARRDRSAVAGLSGWWVPQVSSKCAGLDVDLGPNFQPDGVLDTYNVSEQQILALHLALGERYSAVTTTAADLGVSSLLPSACSSRTLWVSLVPRRFPTGTDALTWCDQESIPVGECGARLVKPPGVPGTRLMLRPGA